MPPSPSSRGSERHAKLPVLGPVLRERETVSHSEMMRFRRCEWRWHLDYELGGRSKIDSPDLAFGDALHGAVESLMEDAGRSVDSALSVFETRLSARFSEMPAWQTLGHVEVGDDGREREVPPPDRAEMSGAAHRIMLDLLAAPELRRATVLASELKLKCGIDRLDDRHVKFSGFVDFIFKAPAPRGPKTLLYVCDFKSCSWGWGADKRRDTEKHSQLMLYKHFVCKELGLDPADVRTVFILLKRRPPKGASSVEFFQVSSGSRAVESAVEMLQSAVTGMARPELSRNLDECVSRWDVCPYKGTELCPSSG